MVKHKKTSSIAQNISLGGLALTTIMFAFYLGIRTSNNIQPVDLTHADDAIPAGDFDHDNEITSADAAIALELALKYREPTASELLADPNADGEITTEDALQILKSLR